ncbi:iron chelate uptake ABC transporter family permease subunit [Sinorhizobium sp. RAC02]|uniref:FecCD family ABC transporter permease n=1 Tax=Sinorhizobium sp. RAC02 TaxID=1842534 RepID=UPI00083D1845|nr:iron chelate uptake ABC transporter family permease subunit [Sinorhizobium sp. RAC02]AOF92753.1 fecCD transport family protein [Sinorhizobium sp. RAC02]
MKAVAGVASGAGIAAVRTHFRLAMFAGILLLGLLTGASLFVGVRPVSPTTVLRAFLAFDAASFDAVVIRDYRLPRTLLGLLAGAAFGVSGALIQAMTRNPLADPGILGVNAGAAFGMILAVWLLDLQSAWSSLGFAFLGALVITAAVYAIGASGRSGASPLRLVLAGVALSAVLGGVGSAIALLDPDVFEGMRHWSIGALAGRDMGIVAMVTPFILAGLTIGLAVAPPLNAIGLGDDLARAFGVGIGRLRLLVILAVTLLAGAATAAVGPIGFVGLMVPHAVRWFTGPDQRRIIPATMLFAPILLLAADIAGRLVLFPDELEAGIVTAALGAPVLILLARRTGAHGL